MTTLQDIGRDLIAAQYELADHIEAADGRIRPALLQALKELAKAEECIQQAANLEWLAQR